MHTRERLIALEARGKGLLAYTLRMRDEVVDVDAAFDTIPDVKPDRKMIEIAEKIIEQQGGKFDPSRFKDRYEDALRELIERKKKGQPVTSASVEEKDEKVVDLMEALRRSLKGGGDGPVRERADRFGSRRPARPLPPGPRGGAPCTAPRPPRRIRPRKRGASASRATEAPPDTAPWASRRNVRATALRSSRPAAKPPVATRPAIRR
ncbi:MAG: hypothetical protein WCH13_14415, partial [Deltaproteobacteria bacterium]